MIFLPYEHVDFHRNLSNEEGIKYFEAFARFYGCVAGWWPDFVTDANGNKQNGWMIDSDTMSYLYIMSGSFQRSGDRFRTIRTPTADITKFAGRFYLPQKGVAYGKRGLGDTAIYTTFYDHLQEAFPDIESIHVSTASGRMADWPIRKGNVEIVIGASLFNDAEALKTRHMYEGPDVIELSQFGAPSFKIFGFDLTKSPPTAEKFRDIKINGVVVARIYGGTGDKPGLIIHIPFPIFPDTSDMYRADVPPSRTVDRQFAHNQTIIKKIFAAIAEEYDKDSEVSINSLRLLKSRALSREIESLAGTISNARKQINDYSKVVMENHKILNSSLLRKQVLEAGKDQIIPKAALEKDLERIKKLSRISGLKVYATGALKFKTDMIYSVNSKRNTRHQIGEMQVSVDTSKAQYEEVLRIVNKTRQGYDGMQAPHVDSSGKLCLGNMTEMMPQLLGELDIPVLISMILQFLESANMDDPWGRIIDSFPVVNTDNVIVDPRDRPELYPLMQKDLTRELSPTLCHKHDPNWKFGDPIPEGVDLSKCLEVRHGWTVSQVKTYLRHPEKKSAAAPGESASLGDILGRAEQQGAVLAARTGGFTGAANYANYATIDWNVANIPETFTIRRT